MILSELFSLCLFPLTVSSVTAAPGPGPVTVVVPAGSYIMLPCSLSTQESLGQKRFDWKKDDQREVFVYDAGLHFNNGLPGQDELFRGRVSHFADRLQFGNASITIRNTRVADSGDYTCAFPLHQRETCNIWTKCAAPKPFVGILNVTEGGVLLKCEVPGASPKPKVEWQDSDGNLLPAEEPQVSHRGDLYYITLLTTVTRTNTNRFLCVATQEELSHVIHDEFHVPGSWPHLQRGLTLF
ncbi:butyrophilin-like protein 1 [Archocentrus centrarchus]|uniref:butyrophilin-like protein 1 n=1 Tax=Archocentrus centrarchus TaxID=63155 RepID=UPI0011EA244D|nr:butyrophilin-like protein 1 [Archocentrus centrarchus]